MVSDVDDPFAVLTDDGVPRGADAVFRAARRSLRRRRIARVAAGVATACVLVGVVVAVVASRAGHGPANGELHSATTSTTPALAFDVPWVDRTMPPLYAPAPVPTTAPATNAPPCTASQLAIVANGQNGAGGTLFNFFSLENVGPAPCLLSGYPSRVVATEPGKPDVVAKDEPDYPDPGRSANVAVGRAGELSIDTFDRCISGPAFPPSYHTLLITFPGGGTVAAHGAFGVSCGLGTSRLGVQQPALAYPRQWYESVSATIQMPPSVAAGTTLTYVVTLANDTAHILKINHCVGYYQHGVDGPLAVHDNFGLNCDTAHSIPAHERVRYQMKLDVPIDAPTGRMTVQWGFAVPTMYPVTAAAKVQVHGNDHPCTSAQLAATAPNAATPFSGSGIYSVKDAGTTLDVVVTNTSSTACTLQGSPRVRILSSEGTDLGVEFVTHGVDLGPPPPAPARVTLDPGQTASSTVAWHSKWCAANPNPVRVELTLPINSNIVTVTPTHGWAPPACTGFSWNAVSSAPFH
jgi:hypothetical protein